MTSAPAWLLALCLFAASPAASAEPAAGTILIVGASHTVGTFGKELEGKLRAWPLAKVGLYAVCSSRPQSWIAESWHTPCSRFSDDDKAKAAEWRDPSRFSRETKEDGKVVTSVKTPSLARLLKSHAPDLVVITLGTNGLTEKSVKDLLAVIHPAGAASGPLCVWVGPPYTGKPGRKAVDGYYGALAANGVRTDLPAAEARQGGCRLIDSRTFTYLDYGRYPSGTGDGTHYEGILAPYARAWAADVEKALGQAAGLTAAAPLPPAILDPGAARRLDRKSRDLVKDLSEEP